MTSKDKRSGRPEEGEHPEAPAADAPEAVHVVVPRAPQMRASAVQGTWSPADWPVLVIAWTVIDTGDPAAPEFATTIALDEGATHPKGHAKERPPKQVVVDVTLKHSFRSVPFSVREETARTPFLSGSLRYEPGEPTAMLTVTDLKYPGGYIAAMELYSD